MPSFPAAPAFPAMPAVAPFPRVCFVNSYGGGGPPATTALTFQRAGLVLANGPTVDPTALKQQAGPNSIVLLYIGGIAVTINSIAAGAPLSSQQIWPGWYGSNAGTYLASAISAAATSIVCVSAPAAGGWLATPFPALISTPGHLTDEVVVVTAVAGNTLTVTRGQWQFMSNSSASPVSQAAAQPAGARIAPMPALSGAYPTEFYGNVTPYCPRCPISNVDPTTGINPVGMKFLDYLAAWAHWTINVHYTTTTYQGQTVQLYDGLFCDNANTLLAFPNANLDADNNNVADGLQGPDGRAVFNGIAGLLAALRTKFAAAGLSQKLLLTNGSPWPGQSNGMFFEGYSYYYGSTPPPFVQQQYFDQVRALTPDTAAQPVTVTNLDIFTVGSDAVSGGNTIDYGNGTGSVVATSQQTAGATHPAYVGYRNYQALRFTLTQALMGNSYVAYDWCPTSHGQTWSADELDKAAGTTLSASITAAATALPVVSGGTQFASGSRIRIPHAVNQVSGSWVTNTEDEILLVGAGATATSIPVTRAQAGSTAGTQAIGTKVLPDYGSGRPSWLGWMGAALGPAQNNLANLGANLIPSNAGAEASTVVVSAATALATGTFPNTDSITGWTLAVTAPAIGFCTSDAATFNPNGPGSHSVRLQVTGPTPGSTWKYAIKPPGATLAVSTTYTFSFWARGDRQQSIQVRLADGASTPVALLQIQLTTVWTQFFLVYTTPGSIASNGYNLAFEVAGETGKYWFDDCACQAGDVNGPWTRDFENAFVIFNGSNASVVVTLPAITSPAGGKTYTTYRKLAGTQDAVTNDGSAKAPGTTVTVPALDGLVLQKA